MGRLILFIGKWSCRSIGLAKSETMRKVLIAFDGVHYSEGAFEWAKALNEREKILLAGVFLPQVSYANLWSYADGAGAPLFVPVLDDEEAELIEENVARFEQACQRNDIEFRVRTDFEDLALPELKKESRFADLMIIGENKFYEDREEGKLNRHLKESLHTLECPVVIVPEIFQFPKVNILAYDGTESSVYAIKQFVYLLPELTSLPTMLTYATADEHDKIPYEAYIEELVARHFPDLTVSKLDLDARRLYATWVKDEKSGILVSGAFGRSFMSRMFRKSFVTEILEDRLMPVFIAHK